MKIPRGLTAQEAELWARVATTVTPLKGRDRKRPETAAPKAIAAKETPARPVVSPVPAPLPMARPARVVSTLDRHGLDSSWDRKLAKGAALPDFTLDLHGASLDAAHARLDHGLAQARGMGARLVLVVTGKPRPADAADRGNRRGAIRAKILDWLAAGSHASAIAAIRKAHPRHGGEGALYVVLRRER